MEAIFAQRVWAAFSTLLVGGGTLVYLINRQLKFADLARGQVYRTIFSIGLVGSASIGGFLASIWLPPGWFKFYFLFVSFLFLIQLVGELRLLIQRLRYKGSGPKERISYQFDGEDLIPSLRRDSLARPLTTTDLQVFRYEVDCRAKLGSSVSDEISLRIASISDFHLNPSIPFRYFESTIDRVNAEQPDLIFLPGDFVTHLEDADRIPELLKQLSAPCGCYASLGNHDYWAGSEEVSALINETHITLLRNQCIEVQYHRNNVSLPLVICGCDDPWGKPLWESPQLTPGKLAFILSHTADNIYRLSHFPVTAVFSGHYHGGQFRIPGFGSVILPSEYGRRFDHGHFEFQNRSNAEIVHLFVSAGVGSANPGLRFYCQPDIFVVNFKVKPL